MSESMYERLKDAVVRGCPDEVRSLVDTAVKMGLDPLAILREGLVKGVRIVGEKYEKGEFFLPDLIMAGNAMSEGSEVLRGVIEERTGGKGMESMGRFLIVTVKDDIHDVGKNIVSTLLKVEGFEVIDLGRDVNAETVIEKVRELKPDLLGLSALLTTTMIRQREVIDALRKAGLRDKVRVIIGGAPTSKEWAEEIGADGWAPDAVSAVKKSRQLLGLD